MPQNVTSSSSKRQRAKNAAQKEWKDVGALAEQYHQIVMTVLENFDVWTEEQREEVTRLIGAVLPLAFAHHKGGARKGFKSAGPWQFITTNCPDAVQPS
ncbi:unnamed protein product [Pylaiella littoralis]